MLNLLPLNLKEDNKKDYLIRVGISLLFFLCVTVLLSIMFFLPSFFLSRVKYNNISTEINLLKESMFMKNKDLFKLLNEEKSKILVLDEKTDNPVLEELLKKVTDKKMTGISLVSFLYEKKDNEPYLIIRGVADTRDRLVIFIKNLEKESYFSKIDLPISNLVKDTEVIFLIKATLKPVQ